MAARRVKKPGVTKPVLNVIWNGAALIAEFLTVGGVEE